MTRIRHSWISMAHHMRRLPRPRHPASTYRQSLRCFVHFICLNPQRSDERRSPGPWCMRLLKPVCRALSQPSGSCCTFQILSTSNTNKRRLPSSFQIVLVSLSMKTTTVVSKKTVTTLGLNKTCSRRPARPLRERVNTSSTTVEYESNPLQTIQ